MNNLHVLVYDGSFDGLLCCLFRIYEQKIEVVKVLKQKDASQDLFDQTIYIQTEPEKSKRVWDVIHNKASKTSICRISNAFISEMNGKEITILKYMEYIVSSDHNIENDLDNPIVLRMQLISKMVSREVQKIKAVPPKRKFYKPSASENRTNIALYAKLYPKR